LQGFADKDVYVCESRYSGRHKAFKKIKLWTVPRNESVRLHLRDSPLIPTRVASVYADASSANPSFDTSSMAPLEKEREVGLLEACEKVLAEIVD
jgi:protein polybromo-1